MNDRERRQLISHGAIGLAACIGAYMGFVDGPRKQLVDTSARVQSLSDQVVGAESLQDQVPVMNASLTRISHDAEEMKEMGRLAREERSLFAAVMSLAGRHNVRLDELNPARITAGPARAAVAPGQTPPAPSNDTTVGYTMVAVAPYSDLVAFASSIRNELGYAVIRSIHLDPVQDERAQLVHAVIETEHYAFDTSAPAVADAGAH